MSGFDYNAFNVILHHLITIALYDDFNSRIVTIDNKPIAYNNRDYRDIKLVIDNSMFINSTPSNKKDEEIISLAIHILTEIATYRDKIKGKRFYHNILSTQEIIGQQFEIFLTTNSIIYKDKGK